LAVALQLSVVRLPWYHRFLSWILEEGPSQLAVRGLAIGIAAIGFFLAAFFLQGAPGEAARAAIAFGLLSAIAWGLGSMGGPRLLSNGSNVFAALFAAATVGFAINVNPACDGGLFQHLCDLRADMLHLQVVPQPPALAGPPPNLQPPLLVAPEHLALPAPPPNLQPLLLVAPEHLTLPALPPNLQPPLLAPQRTPQKVRNKSNLHPGKVSSVIGKGVPF
jgi:hypothetical protein